MRDITYAEWITEAKQKFGADVDAWRFVCPACKHIQCIADMKGAGVPETAWAFSCMGRWTDSPRQAFVAKRDAGKLGPCNYAGGGLFAINPVHVIMPDGEKRDTFEFAV